MVVGLWSCECCWSSHGYADDTTLGTEGIESWLTVAEAIRWHNDDGDDFAISGDLITRFLHNSA